MAMTSILGGASLIKKVYLPKYIFPLSRVLSCFTTMLLSLIALFLVMAEEGIVFHETLLLLPAILVHLLLFCVGRGLILSVLVVFFRVMLHLYSVILTALNFLTPIFYLANLLPDWLQEGLVYNPLYDYITFFRKIAVYGQWPTLEEHMYCLIFSFGSLLLGMYVFKKNQNEFILYV